MRNSLSPVISVEEVYSVAFPLLVKAMYSVGALENIAWLPKLNELGDGVSIGA